MIESNLVAGRQDVVPGMALTYGQSITDGCIDWDDDGVGAEPAGRRRCGEAGAAAPQIPGAFGLSAIAIAGARLVRAPQPPVPA